MTRRAETLLRTHAPMPVVSDFAAAEFASALARSVRMAELDGASAKAAFATLDRWMRQSAERIEIDREDVTLAQG